MSDETDSVTPEPEESGLPGATAEGDVPDPVAGASVGGTERRSEAPRPTGKRRTRPTDSRPARGAASPEGSKRAAGRATARRAEAEAPQKENLFARINRFFREVVAELRKVIWPTRKELVTYTAVVLVFVSFLVALISGLDIVFAKGVLAVFG